ncbi:MAG: hypothetical protein IBV52_04985 [Candidatus Bathyarchaeota archaeon]
MKKRFALPAVCLLLIASTAFFVASVHENESTEETADCYVGVSFCGNTTAEAKLLIDRVKEFTNLLVLQSGPVSKNETATNEICDYAVDAGLNIIVFFGDLDPKILQDKDLTWRLSWLSMAKQQWRDKFLGVYYYDEPAGHWLDHENWNFIFRQISNATYDTVAEFYTGSLQKEGGYKQLKDNSIPAVTSDYTLYWFDYLMGYDVIFAHLGWNHTLEQDIALVRGAANLQNKSWGTMITWKYNHPPYIDTAENIYNQMRISYESGAKYVVIFNYPTHPEGNQYGIMTDEHFEALERFWNDTVKNPEVIHDSTKAEAILVLPKNYGWGMRNRNDKIWAFWGPDEKSHQIWTLSRQLLTQYGTSLDIVYDDPAFPVTGKYPKIYYWNQTITSNP